MFSYVFNKVFKKLRGSAVLRSTVAVTAKVEAGCSIVNSFFGIHSFCGYDCTIINTEIGSFCSIANKVTIGGAAHPMHFVSTSPVFLSHKDSVKAKFAKHDYLPKIETKIGHDVWIGEGAFIKAGVEIGTGAVIGMGSVITKNVPPYAIFAGNPARLIRYRFDDKIIKRLLATEWWLLSEQDLARYGQFIDKPQVFLEALEGKQD